MNEKDLRVIKTKKNLEMTLMKLLKDKSLEKITVTELCQRSGITRKTFYLHYENVPKYLEEFVGHLLDELEESLQVATDYHLQFEPLEPKMIHVFEHVYRNKDFYQFIFSSHSHFAYYEMFFKRIRELFKSSKDTKDQENEVTEFEAAYHANAILGIILEWNLEGYQKSVDDMNRLLLKIIKL